jgi:hypothetical protein
MAYDLDPDPNRTLDLSNEHFSEFPKEVKIQILAGKMQRLIP